MQKFLTILISLFILGCSKEATITETITVQPVQRTVLLYKGATWCGPCGSSGKPVLRAMEAYGDDKIICLSSQTSDGISSPAGDTLGNGLMTRFNQNGIPHMFMGVDGSFKNFYPNQTTANNNLTKNNANAPIAGVYISAVVNAVNGSNVEFEIEVKAKTEFFKDGFGKYTLSIIVLEDDIVRGQTGSSNPDHDNVVRGYGGSRVLGDDIASTTTGSQQNFSCKIAIPSAWNKQNLKVAGIIWSRNGNNYDPVNGTVVKVK